MTHATGRQAYANARTARGGLPTETECRRGRLRFQARRNDDAGRAAREEMKELEARLADHASGDET